MSFKVGDRVVSLDTGKIGRVYSIDLTRRDGFQMKVQFENDDDYQLTPEGKPCSYSEYAVIRLITPLEVLL